MKTQLKADQAVQFEFGEVSVVASVMLVGVDGYLSIGEKGVLKIPAGAQVDAFHTMLMTAKDAAVTINQRNLEKLHGEYGISGLSTVKFADGFNTTLLREPVPVMRKGKNAWTDWGKNKADIWFVLKDGTVVLVQVGIVTHDDGKTFRIIGVCRWKGQLFIRDGNIVGKPDSPLYGAFDARRAILSEPGFRALLDNAKLAKWKGNNDELYPVLPEPPEQGFATVQWWNGEFFGQKGGGPVNLHPDDGKAGWLFADQISGIDPDSDGIVRLHIGDVIRFSGLVREKQVKITGATLVQRMYK